jgi:hypothetical protein
MAAGILDGTFVEENNMQNDAGIHPAEFTEAQISTDPILHFFHYAHLPEKLKGTSRLFFILASTLVTTLPRNAERTVALRKLLEAKDAAVRANLPAPSFEKVCKHDLIFASFDIARNGPSETGKCTACQQQVPTKGYAQSAARAEGFLTRIDQRAIGEPVEIGGHDEDRDGPIDFKG